MAKKRGTSAAPLRLEGKEPTQFRSGDCTLCSEITSVGIVETNWGMITLCKKCLKKAVEGAKLPAPTPKPTGKWASTDVLDHRVAGSPGTGKKR